MGVPWSRASTSSPPRSTAATAAAGRVSAGPSGPVRRRSRPWSTRTAARSPRAARWIIGPGRPLIVDANQLWDLPAARRAAKALSPFDIFWLEEPLPAEDIQAYAALRAAIDIPVAAGESLYTAAQFRDVLLAGAVDYLQPNVCRVGGITPFLRIARLARLFGVPVVPHLLPDISGQLALCLPLAGMIEDIDEGSFAALGALALPSGVVITGDSLQVQTPPGHGLAFATGTLEELT